ncbi:hypothetical protein QRX60_28855 [Amycolatopsis mongoliensis]|uniref:Uncharacterized protein n=1 Tax=Amycolatopsis mongoliensis TaxID=715475 RepID=A0A9Y2JI10_9PSEU|nr:hypothetical protein [Amycolatopsis sp. 4-36]WIX98074.1 hypothetical protein QRX60_28855 [Amycolatopsis sp. 4-36]
MGAGTDRGGPGQWYELAALGVASRQAAERVVADRARSTAPCIRPAGGGLSGTAVRFTAQVAPDA